MSSRQAKIPPEEIKEFLDEIAGMIAAQYLKNLKTGTCQDLGQLGAEGFEPPEELINDKRR